MPRLHKICESTEISYTSVKTFSGDMGCLPSGISFSSVQSLQKKIEHLRHGHPVTALPVVLQ